MTKRQAIALAHRLAKQHDEPHFVLFECGEYEVASETNLDTFYAGSVDPCYCTDD